MSFWSSKSIAGYSAAQTRLDSWTTSPGGLRGSGGYCTRMRLSKGECFRPNGEWDGFCWPSLSQLLGMFFRTLSSDMRVESWNRDDMAMLLVKAGPSLTV